MSEINKMLSRLAAKQQASGSHHGNNNQQAPLTAAKVTPVPSSKAPRFIVGTGCAVLLAASVGWWFGQQPNNRVVESTSEENSFTPVMAANAAEIAPHYVASQEPVIVAETAVPKVQEEKHVQAVVTEIGPAKTVNPTSTDHLTTSTAVISPPEIKKPAAKLHQAGSKAAAKVVVASAPVKPQPRTVQRDIPAASEAQVAQTPSEDGDTTGDESLSIEAVELSGQELAQIEYSRAMKAVKSGNSKKAVEFLAKAVQYNPDWIEARQRLSALYYGRGEVRQAILVLQHGLARDSEQPELRLTMAKLLVNESQPQAALTVLSELPKHAPSKYLAMRGALAQQLKDNTRALESYQQLVKSEPFDGRWWLGLGIALERTNDAEKALNAYQQALAMGQISAQTQQFIQQRVSYLQSQGS